jgi:hypothetical protein
MSWSFVQYFRPNRAPKVGLRLIFSSLLVNRGTEARA